MEVRDGSEGWRWEMVISWWVFGLSGDEFE